MTHALDKRDLSQQIYDVLRDRITTLELLPGERVDIGALREEFGVSTIPIREALKRLTERQLVTATPNVGYHVISFTDQDLLEVFALRKILEGHALSTSIRVITENELHELLRACYGLLDGRGMENGRRERFSDTDIRLHRDLIVGRSGNRLLMDLYAIMADRVSMVIHLSARIDRSTREHIRLLQTMIARDTAAAEEALGQHLESTREDCLPLPATLDQWRRKRQQGLAE